MTKKQTESLEKKIAGAILSRIRKTRSPHYPSPNSPLLSTTPPKLRKATLSDFDAVWEMKRRWGLIADPIENWKRLWTDNPALRLAASDFPIGWVLETGKRVIGYLGNIPLVYSYGERTLLAVAGHGLVVEPAYRTASLTLLSSFFAQKSVDLYLATTAIEPVAKLAGAFKAQRIPQTDYETVLFWVLKPSNFTHALVDGMDLKPSVLPVVRKIASAAVSTDRMLRRRWPKSTLKSLAVSEIAINEIGEDFRELWIAKRSEGVRLMADRSPELLRWHFQIPGDKRKTRVLCCRRGVELIGYMILRSDPATTDGLQKTIIADALIRDDDPSITEALFVAAYDQAKKNGSDILELLGFPSTIRRTCAVWRPYERRYPSCPFQFKAANADLRTSLANPVAWYATPFDGDTTLMP